MVSGRHPYPQTDPEASLKDVEPQVEPKHQLAPMVGDTSVPGPGRESTTFHWVDYKPCDL